MKVFLSFILFFLIATEMKAQVANSSLYITLSDIQSVQIIENSAHSQTVLSDKESGKEGLSIFNPSASQIHKFESQAGNTKIESQYNNKGIQTELPELLFSGLKSDLQLANLDAKVISATPHIVYQIDPR